VTGNGSAYDTVEQADERRSIRIAPDEQRAVGPFWAQTLGMALNSEGAFGRIRRIHCRMEASTPSSQK
jgi:hypothetical protein